MQHQPLDRRQALKLLAAGAGISLLSACDAPQAPLRVGSIVFPGYELMFLARASGLLNEQQVRLLELRSTTDTLRALASGQLEAGNMTLDEMMLARSDGVDLRAILVLDVSLGADVVMARANVNLKNLAGKRIAVEEGAMGAVMLESLLNAAALMPQQIRKVKVTLDQSEEVYRSGAVDALVTAEPYATKLDKLGAKRIFDSASIPGRIVDVLAVRQDAIQTHGTALRNLVTAHFSARQQFLTRPQEAAALMADRLQSRANEVADLFRGLKLPDARENLEMLRPGGSFDRTALELQRVMVENNLMSRPKTLDSLSTKEFLPG